MKGNRKPKKYLFQGESIMQQLKKPFRSCYYLLENGNIYDESKKQEKQADSNHMFRLLTEDNKQKKVSLKRLYRELYNKEYCKDNIESLQGEEWREIENTEGKYYVSNKGRIKSLEGYEAKILKPFISNSSKYQRVDIFENGKRATKLVHQLVALYFLPFVFPANPFNLAIHHKDLDISNNAADNLTFIDKAKHCLLHQEIRRERKNATISNSTESTDN